MSECPGVMFLLNAGLRSRMTRKGAADQWFRFAWNHTLLFWRPDIAYTFIPKNGCSTLRLTLAAHNGMIEDPESEHEFIHYNNDLFVASLKDAFNTEAAFVVLRDPAERAVSLFLDKFVGGANPARQFCKHAGVALRELTFTDYCRLQQENPECLYINHHWVPQHKFLLFEKSSYTRVFMLEEMEDLRQWLMDRGIVLREARALTRHGTDQLAVEDIPDAATLDVAGLEALRQQGVVPRKANFVTDETGRRLESTYREDYTLLNG